MKALTFRGGVHPPDNKSSTNDSPIVELEPSAVLVYPLIQHIGAPAKPLVEVGDYVKLGQKIGDSQEHISSPIHASVSGRVTAVEPRPHPNGEMIEAIVVENDYRDLSHQSVTPTDPAYLAPDDIVKLVRETGIVGMGGAGFPTHVKLNPPPSKKIELVIVNGAECEPYLTSDNRVMIETPGDVLFGLKLILKRFNIQKAYVGIETNKRKAITAMTKITDPEEDIWIKPLKTKYPQGSEKQLIEVLTGRQVPSGGLPADVGVVVVNIDTCAAICRAVTLGVPLIRRIVTVAGDAVRKPANFSVRIGTMFSHLLESAGGCFTEKGKVVMGGPMMGIAQYRLDVPVVKGTSGLLVFSKNYARIPEQQPCIRCGRCVEACPVNLAPLFINAYAEQSQFDRCGEYNAMDCIECGACTYICPAKRHIAQSIKLAKQMIRGC